MENMVNQEIRQTRLKLLEKIINIKIKQYERNIISELEEEINEMIYNLKKFRDTKSVPLNI